MTKEEEIYTKIAKEYFSKERTTEEQRKEWERIYTLEYSLNNLITAILFIRWKIMDKELNSIPSILEELSLSVDDHVDLDFVDNDFESLRFK